MIIRDMIAAIHRFHEQPIPSPRRARHGMPHEFRAEVSPGRAAHLPGRLYAELNLIVKAARGYVPRSQDIPSALGWVGRPLSCRSTKQPIRGHDLSRPNR